MRSWEQLLINLLGWTPRQARHWAEAAAHAHHLEDEDSLAYHEVPAYWLVRPILDSFQVKLSGRALRDAERQVLTALDIGRHDFSEATEWGEYRRKLSAIEGQLRQDLDRPILT